MGIAVIGLIVFAVLALIAIPVIAAVVGRSTTDEDPNRTGDPEHDPNVESRREAGREPERNEVERDESGKG
ncbi:MAG: hypothetical protein H0U65_06075 [Rubrobacter sp.]|nr:hypothetical protein [Rubrobacter sp.]